ncbi:hypothetical protein ACC792_32000 [Rhizobium ruizarguesonis]
MKTAKDVRNWLGIFFLGTTSVLGAYILLFQQTMLLPVSSEDAQSAFKIIIPTFLAQLTIVFKWFADPPKNVTAIRLPPWVVIGPPIAIVGILMMTIIYLVVDQGKSTGGATFTNVVTFCVSLLSATSVFIVTAVFNTSSNNRPPADIQRTSQGK